MFLSLILLLLDMASELSVILSDEWYGNVNFYMFHGGTSFGFLNGANVLPIFPHYLADVSSYGKFSSPSMLS